MSRLEEVEDLLARSSHAIAAKQEEIKSVLALALGPNATDDELNEVMVAQIEWWSNRERPNGNDPCTAIDGLLQEHHRLLRQQMTLLDQFKTIRQGELA